MRVEKHEWAVSDTFVIGPAVHQDVFSILLRFHTHQIAFMAEIEKLYQQVRVYPKDTGLQRILLRVSSDTLMQAYELQVVTYRTSLAHT